MSRTQEILMAGTGGQGLIAMASLLAEAAIEEGRHVAQTQSYGVAQRGGFISAEVVIGSEPVLYQNTRNPDVIIALHGVVGSRYDACSAPVVFDSTLLERDLPNWIGIPCTAMAAELGVVKAANIVAMGAMARVRPIVSTESLEAAIRHRFKGKQRIAELNIQALRQGFAAAGALTAE